MSGSIQGRSLCGQAVARGATSGARHRDGSVATSKKTLAAATPPLHLESMPRPPRDTRAGIFHVFTHCVWAAPALFRDDLSRMVFLRELARATRSFEWTCIGFCLMRTHYHLMLEVPDNALPIGMQSLNFRYAIDFNQRHAMRGHVQFARYGAVRITDDSQLLTAYKYIARNPVEARLCTSCQDWRWSSYAGTIGLAAPHSFVDPMRVLQLLGSVRETAASRLQAFVDEP
jgi:putative transposase